MSVNSLSVSSRLGAYTVEIVDAEDAVAEHLETIVAAPHLAIVDERVWDLYRGRCLSALDPARVVVLQAVEERKNLDSVSELYDAALTHDAKRGTHILVVGGGITQDVAGFAACTLFRGTPWSFVPTTLLAQADSCIGGKTSLNYGSFKNLLGTFAPPKCILLWSGFTDTLTDQDYASGVGEVVKLHILGGDETKRWLTRHLTPLLARDRQTLSVATHTSLRIKTAYIEEDEFDLGSRRYLNYGHCFGHAFETATGFAVPHGQAVVLGMLCAQQVATRRGLIDTELNNELVESLLVPAVTLKAEPATFRKDVVLEAMRRDKKRMGQGLAVVVVGNGCVPLLLSDVSDAEIATVLEWASSRLDTAAE